MNKIYSILIIAVLIYVIFFSFVILRTSVNKIRVDSNEQDKSESELLVEIQELNKKLSNINLLDQDNIKIVETPSLVKNVDLDSKTEAKDELVFNYLAKYPSILNCKNDLPKWSPTMENLDSYDYSKPYSNDSHSLRITRALIMYFPIESLDRFAPEVKWLYRSWINMQIYEPIKWRTDLIFFIQRDENIFNKSDLFLNDLNCKFTNRRTGPEDKPMCILIDYIPLKNRKIPLSTGAPDYNYLLDKINIFSEDSNELSKFYSLLNQNLLTYGYLDSILMAFEGFSYFKSAGYDFLIRSDIDIFLTPLFSLWLPRFCNDFTTGGGGYSTEFNVKRFKRIADNLRLSYAGQWNFGSTWYSNPEQFRLVSYLTLFGMAYLSAEEFSQPEREGKVGTILWPDWHYGVLLLYGQNIALNHLLGSKSLNVAKLYELIDYPTTNQESIFKKILLHVYHDDKVFSKFAFFANKYDNVTIDDNSSNSTKTFHYALRMALESKRASASNLYQKFVNEISEKKV